MNKPREREAKTDREGHTHVRKHRWTLRRINKILQSVLLVLFTTVTLLHNIFYAKSMKNANKKWCHNVHISVHLRPPCFLDIPGSGCIDSPRVHASLLISLRHPSVPQGFVSINHYSCFPAIASIRPWSLVTAPLLISSLFVPTPTPHLNWIHLLLHEMDLIMVIIGLTLCGVYRSMPDYAVNMKKKYGMRSLLVWKYKKSIKKLCMRTFFISCFDLCMHETNITSIFRHVTVLFRSLIVCF